MPRRPLVASATSAGWAGFASFLAIFVLSSVNSVFQIQGVPALTLIGSFGATAVLVYSAPRAEFSRFRNVIYGHGLSAATGVTVALLLGTNHALAAASAVGLAVVVMHITQTTHPPGGATALIAVTGGEHISQLGYLFVFVPVLLGAMLMYGLSWFGREFLYLGQNFTEEPLDDA